MNIDGKKLIIFDADGTLRRCTVPGQPCPNKPGEWELLPGVKEKAATLSGVHFAIVSNQGGVGLGLMDEQLAMMMLFDTFKAAFGEARTLIFMCSHAPKDGCDCRKPSPYMLYRAMRFRGHKPAETLYVGDMDSDREAAQRAGVDFLWAWEFFGWPHLTCAGCGEKVSEEDPRAKKWRGQTHDGGPDGWVVLCPECHAGQDPS